LKTKDTSVASMVAEEVVDSLGSTVPLAPAALLRAELHPGSDVRRTVRESAHQLIRALEAASEDTVKALDSELGGMTETVGERCSPLGTVCERTERSTEVLSHNSFAQSRRSYAGPVRSA